MTYEEALEKLKYLIGGESDQYPPDYDIPIQVAIEALEKQIPIVRGEWILTEYPYGCKQYRCSNCANDSWWDKNFAYGDEKFCPNCGADMQGESK